MKLLYLLFSLPVLAEAQTKCSFLPDTQPIELTLPASVLSHPLKDLPLEFRGVSPIVYRKTIKSGEKPKITVQKYSSEPTIVYDEVEGKVIVSAASCDDSEVSDSGSSSCSSFWPLAGATLLAGMASGPTAAAGVAAAGLLQGARAHEESCDAVVQLVVEAPNSYVGAYDTCMNEINDPAICPEPFREFETCEDAAPSCGLVVVGAGAGGLYTALRMVDDGKIDASEVCVFEMTERVGGRLFSLRGLGPDGTLTVDAGGYRTWPEFTPTSHALITEYLGIPMDCYDDSDPCQVYNIVDDEGKKAGFTLFVEEMMQRLVDGGACFYPYHELKSFDKVEDPSNPNGSVTKLNFANGVTATATFSTVLNIPQRPLLNIVRNSDLDNNEMINFDFETMDALHSVQTVIATKLYLYYPKGSVWWHQMGLREGDFELGGNAREMLLAGRYHDGQVECDDENDLSTCHGFLLAVYSNDLSGNKAQYFRRFQREREEPVTFITNDDLEGREFLRHAHQRLIDYHLEQDTDSELTGYQIDQLFRNIEQPTYGILSTWNTAVPWAGGAWHQWTDLSNIQLAKQPFVNDNIFVVNEAYSLLHGWAEGSIKVADEILEEHFDIERPWDFPVVDINQIVLQTSSEECVEPSDGSGGSGGGGGGSGGGGGDDISSVLCFAGDALVSMADGTMKPIRDVQEGDMVVTGTGRGAGRVTEALVHPVEGGKATLTVLETSHGPLVGTVDHPVLSSNGRWVDFKNLMSEQSSMFRTEEIEIDVLYNLEIDADDVEGSSHSYKVNGIVASGNGDNKILNLRFPRQHHHKKKAAAIYKITG